MIIFFTLFCSCNSSSARCTRCTCVKRKKPCVSCLPIQTGNCRNTFRSGQVSSSSPLSFSGSTTRATCQWVPPAGSQVVDSDSVNLSQVTSVGVESPQEVADAQVPSVRSSISGRKPRHEQEDGIESLNEDTDPCDS